jgi:hypothetical protein
VEGVNFSLIWAMILRAMRGLFAVEGGVGGKVWVLIGGGRHCGDLDRWLVRDRLF